MYPRTFIGPLRSAPTNDNEKTQQELFIKHSDRLVIDLLNYMPEVQVVDIFYNFIIT